MRCANRPLPVTIWMWLNVWLTKHNKMNRKSSEAVWKQCMFVKIVIISHDFLLVFYFNLNHRRSSPYSWFFRCFCISLYKPKHLVEINVFKKKYDKNNNNWTLLIATSKFTWYHQRNQFHQSLFINFMQSINEIAKMCLVITWTISNSPWLFSTGDLADKLLAINFQTF